MEKRWWKESVVYQIYPRSFCDSNGDGIGDLNGITGKLDYLKELGIDVIWLSPVYKSPNDDNGYDISDYQAIMDEFGTMEDFDRMLATAHEKGIKIMMDLVVNHTSDEHKWFIESRKSTDNPYRDYYIWRPAKEDGSLPNNWGSCFSGPAWEYDKTTDMYFLHLFSKKQPDLNWDNPAVRQDVFDMMNWWLKKGVDGFRMDVISLISKEPGLPDKEPGINGYATFNVSANGPHVHEYLQEMRQKALNNADTITVGECSGVTLEEAKKYARSDEKELNMVFQFEHMDVDSDEKAGKWTTRKMDLRNLKKILTRWQKGLQDIAWNSLYWENHDQPRSVSRFGNDNPAYRETSAKMLATCLHMMQGTPYIYEGEELGMTNAHFESIDEYKDVEALDIFRDFTERKGFSEKDTLELLGLKSRDNARTPMQWDNTVNAGFTEGTPWIGVNKNCKEINVEQCLADQDSIFYYYQKLIQLRHEMPIITDGVYELLDKENESVYAYLRKGEKETLLVVGNFTDKTINYHIEEKVQAKKSRLLISNYNAAETFERDLSLEPYGACVYLLEAEK